MYAEGPLRNSAGLSTSRVWLYIKSTKYIPSLAVRSFTNLKVQLTPKIIFPLTKSTSFPNYFSEKIISIDKIPAFLQAFKVVISCPTTEQNGIWVGLLVTSSKELGSKNSRDFDWASSPVKT